MDVISIGGKEGEERERWGEEYYGDWEGEAVEEEYYEGGREGYVIEGKGEVVREGKGEEKYYGGIGRKAEEVGKK